MWDQSTIHMLVAVVPICSWGFPPHRSARRTLIKAIQRAQDGFFWRGRDVKRRVSINNKYQSKQVNEHLWNRALGLSQCVCASLLIVFSPSTRSCYCVAVKGQSGEREREREGQRERGGDRERERDWEREGDRERDRERDTERERDRERGREGERETDRQTDRQTETDRDRETERETEREFELENFNTQVKDSSLRSI